MFEWLKHKGKLSQNDRNTDAELDCKMPLEAKLSANLKLFKQLIGHSADVVIRCLKPDNSEPCAAVVYVDGLADSMVIQEHVIKPVLQELFRARDGYSGSALIERIRNAVLTVRDSREAGTLNECIHEVLSGNTVFLLEGSGRALILTTPGWKTRSPDEPISEPSVRGPRDGFVETLQENIVRLRRRIKDPNFTMVKFKVGRRTKTDTAVIYIKGIANQELVDEVQRRLSRIDMDSIIASGYIEQLIEDNFLSLFPQIQYTERPDKVVAGLMEGRVAILLDNTPFALIVPTTFSMFIQAPEDYYDRWVYSSLIRMMRYVAIIISLFLPAVYIALVSYHQGLIPTKLAIFIAATREGIPFPSLIEALIMEATLEILREAGVRLPKSIGQAVGIVGGLVIGEAASRAGIVSPEMVIIVSLTAVSSFSVPQYAIGISMRMLRFVIMFAAGILGLYGVMLAFIMITVHLVKLKSFGIDYMAPIAPVRLRDWKDFVFRMPVMMMKQRPELLKSRDRKRKND